MLAHLQSAYMNMNSRMNSNILYRGADENAAAKVYTDMVLYHGEQKYHLSVIINTGIHPVSI